MTVLQKKPTSPIDHLSPADIEEIGRELDAIRAEFIEKRGASDAAYIRKVIDTQRKLELGSRAVLLFSLFPPAWFLGTAGAPVPAGLVRGYGGPLGRQDPGEHGDRPQRHARPVGLDA